MNRTMFRRAARAMATALAAALVIAPMTTAPAVAAPASDEPAFTMVVFPHEGNAVHFWDSWGARRSGGRRHKGTDIMSPRGTEVVAVADGVVTDFGHHRMSGYYVRIDHGGGWTTTAMHLNNDTLGTDDGEGGEWAAFHAELKVGDEVKAGDVIGYVGDSGNAEGTQPHTHFEVKFDGKKLNPYPFLHDVWHRQTRLANAGHEPL